jgi:hypothetical protein
VPGAAYGESVVSGESEELGYDASQHAWTSKRVLIGPVAPQLVTKRPPEHVADDADSGWTVGTGDEPGLGPDEFEWSPVGVLTDMFPALDPVFRAGTGSWRWSTSDGRYVSAS